MPDLNYTDIEKTLKEWNYETSFDEASQQLITTVDIDEGQLPIIFRIMEGHALFQICTAFPLPLSAETYPDLARLLHMLNKDIDVPGFGLDEDRELIFYRWMIPCKDQQLDEEFFRKSLEAVKDVANIYVKPIYLIASGTMSLEDLLKQSQSQGS